MLRRKVLLFLAAALFAGWMIYLFQLALSHRDAVVLSRPQLLVTDVLVVAEINRPDRDSIEVAEVLSKAEGFKGTPPKKGDSVSLKNLAGCEGIQPGTRKYIVPLKADGADGFDAAIVPRSPGYGGGRPRVYPDTDENRKQATQFLP
jgi:hypothetical protein